jgi:MFS family permease
LANGCGGARELDGGRHDSDIASRRLGRAPGPGTLIAGCLAVCVAQIGLVLPAPINGVIQQQLHASGSQLTWISDAFILPTAILELTFGVLGDLFGRKRLLIIGGLLTAGGHSISATTSSVHALWLGQAVAGVGAAVLFPSSLAIIAAATTTPAERARGLAYWASSLSAGALIAPLVSGNVAEHTTYHWAFGAIAILGVLTALVSLTFATESSAPLGRGLDWPGQISVAVALFALLYGLIEGPEAGWGSVKIIGCFVVATAALVAFLLVESRSVTPMLRLDLFRIPAFAAAAAVALVGMFSFLGTGYDLSIRLGAIQHQSPLRSALPFVVAQGVPLIVGLRLSRILRDIDARWVLPCGLVVLAAGQVWLANVPITDTSFPSTLGPAALIGFGFILLVAGLTAAAVNSVPLRLAGMASATTSLFREFGQVLGLAIVSAVALSRAGSTLNHRLAAAKLTVAQHHIVGAVATAGGPFAVLNASLGPLSAKVAPIAEGALAHGFDVGLIVCAAGALVAAAIAVTFLGGAHAGEAAVAGLE